MSVPTFEFDTVKFSNEINILCENGFSCMEAILHWCEKNQIEMESIVPFIKKDTSLKSRLVADADSLHMMKKTTKLPEM